MAKSATGIDVGGSGVRLLQAAKSGESIQLLHFHFRARQEGEDSGEALAAAAGEAGWKLGPAAVGLTGKDLILRYTKVPPVPDAQLRNLMRFEVDDLSSQSGGDISADFNLLPVPTDLSGEDTVLLALAKNSLLQPFVDAQQGTSCRVAAFSPNSIALYNAYLRFGKPGQETVLLANLGGENVDLALVSGTDLYFARNLSGGGSALTEAISSRFNVSEGKAEQLKKEFVHLDPAKKSGPSGFPSPQHEKVTNAVLGAAGQISTLLQSTVLFAKTQTKAQDLRVTKVLLCGGGARLAGLPEYLASAMGVTVEIFDPFEEVDLSALTDAEARLLDANRLESVVALGLAVSPLEPSSLYSIEILPEPLRKRREFYAKQIYLAAAGAALLLFLGADFFMTRSQAEEAHSQAEALRRRSDQRKKVDQQAKDLLEEIETLSKRALLLEQKVGVGNALAKALDLLQTALPAELWVSSVAVELSTQKDPELRIDRERVPVVKVEGRGREGLGNLSQVFQVFTEKVRRQVPQAAVKQSISTARGFSFVLEINFFAQEQAPAEEKGAKG